MHWAKNCPHKSIEKEKVNITETNSDNKSDNEEVNIILMMNEYEILINKMEVNAVIDTACTKTVSGENWFQNYLKCLDDTALNKVKVIPSEKTFKFGDGRKIVSRFQATIPANIGSTDCFIQTEIVNEKIPLLLSKTSLKKAETLLNLKEDKVKMFNQKIKKCIYGLGDASHKWYNSVKAYLLSIGLVMSKADADPALFYYHKDSNFTGMIAIHVDNFLWSGTTDFERNFISKL